MFKTARKAMYLAAGGILNKDKVERVVEKTGYTSAAEAILKEVGDEEIERIYVKRTPLGEVMKFALNAASLGEFKKRFADLPYDDLFHLRLDIELTNGKRITVEKNSVITLTRKPKTAKNTDPEPNEAELFSIRSQRQKLPRLHHWHPKRQLAYDCREQGVCETRH